MPLIPFFIELNLCGEWKYSMYELLFTIYSRGYISDLIYLV